MRQAEFHPQRILRRPFAAEADPHRKNADADDDRLPTERPAHFGDERAHCENQPQADQCFGEVKPVGRGRAEFSLRRREQDEDDKRRDADGGGVNCENVSRNGMASVAHAELDGPCRRGRRASLCIW